LAAKKTFFSLVFPRPPIIILGFRYLKIMLVAKPVRAMLIQPKPLGKEVMNVLEVIEGKQGKNTGKRYSQMKIL